MKRVVISKFVFSYIKPTLILMRLFGFMPINFYVEKNYCNFERSRKWTVYSYGIAFILGTWGLFGVWMDATSNTYSFRNECENDIYISLADIVGVALGILFGILTSPFKHKHILRTIELLDKIHYTLDAESGKFVSNGLFPKLIIFFAYIFCIPLLLFDLYIWIKNRSMELVLLYLRNYMFLYFLYLLAIAQQISFCNMIYFVKRRVIALNYGMRSLMKESESSFTKFHPVIYRNSSSDIHIENTLLKSAKSHLIISKLRNLMEAQEYLFLSVESLNEYYGYPLLCTLLNSIIQLVILSWSMLTNYFNRGTEGGKVEIWILNLFWLFFFTARLLLVIETSHMCLIEFKKTNSLVMQLQRKTTISKVREELQVFIQQEKLYQVDFTAAGVVSIRRSIFSKILSSVSTYLVILLNFNHERRIREE